MLENILLGLQNFYSLVERLQVTPEFLLGLAVLFALAGLLAMREAASWFFKVDDLKRDIGRIQETALQLETELRLVQSLLTQTLTAQSAQSGETQPAAELETTKPSDEHRPASFPISH